MTNFRKNETAAFSNTGRSRRRLRKKIGELDHFKFNAVDLAIFGAAFALLADRAGYASNDKVFREVLKNNKKPKLEFDPKEFIIEVGGSSAEALTFSGLLSNLRSDIVKKTDKSFAEKYIIQEPSSIEITTPETLLDEEFKLEDILGLEGDLVTQIAVDPDQQGSTADVPGSYTAECIRCRMPQMNFWR